MDREAMLHRLNPESREFDFIVIGGGASGVGVALEAVSRGYSVALFEKHDFAKSTSGKSTKLVHGGVRYLAQGNIVLVREACIERGVLLQNAAHLVKNQSFVIPLYGWYDTLLYTIGLKFYDLLAGSYSLGKSESISARKTKMLLPGIKDEQLVAGVLYHDGQFDDARLALNVLQTAAELGAVVLNYVPVTGLTKNVSGKVDGVIIKDSITGKEKAVKGKVIINATGVFADKIMQMDLPESNPVLQPSQGTHLVLDKSFLPGDHALMIPKTDDGRVLFAVPWHGEIVVGTTDTPVKTPSPEPVASEEEISFILNTAGRYLKNVPHRSDIKSIFSGLRPLAVSSGKSKKTKELSRSHKIIVSTSGLLTMVGGKWTTFRKMAEDMVDKAEKVNRWKKTLSITRNLKIHGCRYTENYADPLYVYGTDKEHIQELIRGNPEMGEYLSESLGIMKAQVIWAVRHEMALCIEDFLSRRTRALLLDARESLRIAPETARIMAEEMQLDELWISRQVQEFEELAKNYLPMGN